MRLLLQVLKLYKELVTAVETLISGMRALPSPAASAHLPAGVEEFLESVADVVDLQFLHAKALRFQGALLAGSAPHLTPALAQQVLCPSLRPAPCCLYAKPCQICQGVLILTGSVGGWSL